MNLRELVLDASSIPKKILYSWRKHSSNFRATHRSLPSHISSLFPPLDNRRRHFKDLLHIQVTVKSFIDLEKAESSSVTSQATYVKAARTITKYSAQCGKYPSMGSPLNSKNSPSSKARTLSPLAEAPAYEWSTVLGQRGEHPSSVTLTSQRRGRPQWQQFS